jgi:hypothetical protein
VVGDKEGVLTVNGEMKARSDCDDIGELTEYVGCKIERKEDYVKFTQPVYGRALLMKKIIENRISVRTPAETGKVLVQGEVGSELKASDQTKYRCGVRKLLHIMRWSRPEIYNSVRGLSRCGVCWNIVWRPKNWVLC